MILLLIIFFLLAIHYAVCSFYISKGLKNTESENKNELPEEFVSVIIPFRNESINILHSLESITRQDFPKEKYEVIFVDDKSEDDSLEKINQSEKSFNVKVISVPPDYYSDSSKIRAVKFGIDNSKGKIIIITDCDCIHSVNWINSMLKCFNKSTGFIAGPVALNDKNTFFNKIQKLEFSGLILAGAGLIGINKPIICNSANMAFRSEAYNVAGGFQINSKSNSSADEYLMISIKNKTNYSVKFCHNKDSIAYTKASNSIIDFFYQRKRWASKDWRNYGIRILLQLLMIYFFFAGLFVQIILGILSADIFFYSVLVSLIVKFYSEYNILKYGRGLFYDKIKLKIFFLAEILHIPYILIAGLSGLSGRVKWKNRK